MVAAKTGRVHSGGCIKSRGVQGGTTGCGGRPGGGCCRVVGSTNPTGEAVLIGMTGTSDEFNYKRTIFIYSYIFAMHSKN